MFWLSAHESRKIQAWEDMRIQNVDDYPSNRNSVCVHAEIREKVSAESKPCLKNGGICVPFGEKFQILNQLSFCNLRQKSTPAVTQFIAVFITVG